MNEGLNIQSGIRCDVRNPPGQRVVWNGVDEGRTSMRLRANQAYHPIAFEIFPSGTVYVLLEEIQEMWFDARRFTEYTGD